uniref:Uncharacterized protein n=1 Tax=Oryza sativa subsp. japonica TaxID=39947 RepID=Q7F8U3_ORYSJ|nr:hypothetical protein [Oryza sativa Japonica Group]
MPASMARTHKRRRLFASVHVCHCHRLPKRQNKPSQDVVRPGTENAAGVGSGGKAGRRRKKAKATALFGRQRG